MFITDLWESVFQPGLTPALKTATHGSFVCLIISLSTMIYISGSIHFVNLLIIALLLWATVTWFIAELNREQAKLKSNEELAKEGEKEESKKTMGNNITQTVDGDDVPKNGVKKKFMPKKEIHINPPKYDPITLQELSKYDGIQTPKIYIAIKSTVFDVTRNSASYAPDKSYHAFVGRDASRALGKSSLKPEDTDSSISWDYSVLNFKQLKVLNDWYTFFENRYDIVGVVTDLPATLPSVESLMVEKEEKEKTANDNATESTSSTNGWCTIV
ncbi:hypothetical protein CANARDRAFT_235893 [[Candida] arabinofermentans NRRL YB-2248]|uniref:Cytochrome b5 heme-binding domain-containing protein n=1 Tax=[Candida] arabinofermentans NRRL YB-2248 TaxID=983967 RepID=A0A1E4SYS5_9ASCO|nr:hypothetical protein CANARDRAFT_235893 [[Candida] arabinofermentans NRRL YB-2248]